MPYLPREGDQPFSRQFFLWPHQVKKVETVTEAVAAVTALPKSAAWRKPPTADASSSRDPAPPPPLPMPPKPNRKAPGVPSMAPHLFDVADEPDDFAKAENDVDFEDDSGPGCKQEPENKPSGVDSETSQNEAGVAEDGQDMEQGDPPSDPEDERQQGAVILQSLDKMIAVQTRKEEQRAQAGASAGTKRRPIHLLLMVQKLMQSHGAGEATHLEEVNIVLSSLKATPPDIPVEDQVTELAATSQMKKEKAEPDEKETQTEEDSENEEGEAFDAPPPVPQARDFLLSLGYEDWDDVVNGKTVVHHCCYESQTRNVNIRF